MVSHKELELRSMSTQHTKGPITPAIFSKRHPHQPGDWQAVFPHAPVASGNPSEKGQTRGERQYESCTPRWFSLNENAGRETSAKKKQKKQRQPRFHSSACGKGAQNQSARNKADPPPVAPQGSHESRSARWRQRIPQSYPSPPSPPPTPPPPTTPRP